MSDPKSGGPAADRKTLVEEGTDFRGSVSSNCPVVVKGKVDGDVKAPSLTVSSTGAVHGKVKVEELKSQGEIAGEFDADVVQLSGSVKDNTVIRAKSLEVKLAPANGGKMQVVFGECTLEIGDPTAATARTEDTSREIEPKGKKSKTAGPAPSVPPPGDG